jgi:MFS family permease
MIGSSATAILAFAMRRSLQLPNTPAPRRPSFAVLRRARVGGRMLRAWILGVLKLGTYWTCYTWLPGFLVKEMHQSLGRSMTWVLTAQTGQLLGMLAFGNVADRIGRRPAFFAFSLLTAGSIAPLAFAWPWLTLHLPIFWATMFCLGLGSGCTAGFGALLAELYPLEIRGLAMGTTYNLARSVQLFAPIVVGWAVAQAGLAGGLSVPMLLALATASWVWVLPETRGIALTSMSDGEAASGTKVVTDADDSYSPARTS